MKNQYVGDIGDYGKYGLLRFLAEHGITIGVNRYLTNNDGSADGKFTKYLDKPEDEKYDPDIFSELKNLAGRKDKSVQMVEAAELIPGAVYYNAELTANENTVKAREINRRLWFNNSLLLLKDALRIRTMELHTVNRQGQKTVRNISYRKKSLSIMIVDRMLSITVIKGEGPTKPGNRQR